MHTIPINLDDLYNGKRCARYEREMRQYIHSLEFRTMIMENIKLIRFLETNAGIEIENLNDIQKLYNTLWIQRLRNRT